MRGLSRVFKSLPAEPVLFLQFSEVLGRHWLPPFSGFSDGPGSVVFSCDGFARWRIRAVVQRFGAWRSGGFRSTKL